MNDYKAVLVISDMHVGSVFGMMPPGFTTSEGINPPLNMGQKYLLDCWEDIKTRLPKKIDVLVLNGDLVEGQAKLDEGRGLSENDPTFQEAAAIELLEPIARRSGVVYSAAGSKYHTGKGSRSEETIARQLGARPSMGKFCQPMVNFTVSNSRFCCHHNQPLSTRYRSTALESEIGYALEYSGRTEERSPDVFVLSHLHWGFGMWREAKHMAVSTPPMKLQDTFMASASRPWRYRPYNIGVVLFKVYTSVYNGFNVHAEPLLYDHPRIGV
jgi:hypothetical protein